MTNESYEPAQEEENEGGFTFSEFFRIVLKKIWWVLGISVAVALIVGLVNMYALKPGKIEYELTFMIEYPNSADRLNPDGTPFRYESIIYSDRLNAVKEANDEFANIDVDKMTTSRSISISEATRTEAQTVSDLGIYTIKAKGSYFSSEKQASEFLRAVCEKAVSEITAMVENSDYSASLVAYQSNTTFADRIASLEAQQTFLLAEYDKLMEQYGKDIVNGKAINAYRSELAAALNGDIRISNLKTDLELNRYLLSESPSEVELKIDKLDRQKRMNDSIISQQYEEMAKTAKILASQGVSGDKYDAAYVPFTTVISSLQEENIRLSREITELKISIGYEYVDTGSVDENGDSIFELQKPESLTPVNSEKFSSDMETLYTIMQAQTDTCKTVIGTLYREKSKAVLQQNNVSVSGGQSTILLAAVGFVVALILSAIVVYCIERFKQNSKQAAAVRTAPSASPELKLEAAVTEEKKKDKE